MADEGLGRLGIARGPEEEVFEFAAQPSQIENAVGQAPVLVL